MMDWISIIVGLLVGGGGIYAVFRKKIKALMGLVNDLVFLYNRVNKTIAYYRKAKSDGKIDTKEMDNILRMVESDVDEIKNVIEDYREVIGNGK